MIRKSDWCGGKIPDQNQQGVGPGTGIGTVLGQTQIPDALRAKVEHAIAIQNPPKLSNPPNVENCDSYLLRNMMPVDGPMDHVHIAQNGKEFFLSSYIMSMAGPEYSGTTWTGPYKLD